jgi:hypothetical protein
MHYKDITRTALEKGWLVTEGKTPESTMYAQILTEIKRYKDSGRISQIHPAWERNGWLDQMGCEKSVLRE